MANLAELIKTMDPILHPETIAFTLHGYLPSPLPDSCVGMFKEDDGFTVLVPLEVAQNHRWKIKWVAAWITLRVHSDLEAIGFTAAFSRALANEGISCNVFAAIHHDHIFVSQHQGHQALAVLQAMDSGVGE